MKRSPRIQVLALLSTLFVVTGTASDCQWRMRLNAPPDGRSTLIVLTSTTGSNVDRDGYSILVTQGENEVGSSSALGPNDEQTLYFSGASGTRIVRLRGLAENCYVAGANPRTVQLAAGAATTTTFRITCTSTG